MGSSFKDVRKEGRRGGHLNADINELCPMRMSKSKYFMVFSVGPVVALYFSRTADNMCFLGSSPDAGRDAIKLPYPVAQLALQVQQGHLI